MVIIRASGLQRVNLLGNGGDMLSQGSVNIGQCMGLCHGPLSQHCHFSPQWAYHCDSPLPLVSYGPKGPRPNDVATQPSQGFTNIKYFIRIAWPNGSCKPVLERQLHSADNKNKILKTDWYVLHIEILILKKIAQYFSVIMDWCSIWGPPSVFRQFPLFCAVRVYDLLQDDIGYHSPHLGRYRR